MKLINVYEKYKNNIVLDNYDFHLIRVDSDILLGEDTNKNPIFAITSKEPNSDGIAFRTKKLSFECNLDISYKESNELKNDCCHIIRCFSKEKREISMFYELCESMFLYNENNTIDYITEVFNTLNDFFTEKEIMSKSSAQGLYAELFTIYYFRDKYDFAKCWQKKDKMKYDFSLSDSIKLEVKSTIKEERIHRFKHDQLLNTDLKIYVLSYKFLEDNDGLSLKELIVKTISLLKEHPKKQSRLIYLLHSQENDDVLNEMKFSESYTKANIKFMDAKYIPKFKGATPINVSHAEYDSNCEDVPSIDLNELLNFN